MFVMRHACLIRLHMVCLQAYGSKERLMCSYAYLSRLAVVLCQAADAHLADATSKADTASNQSINESVVSGSCVSKLGCGTSCLLSCYRVMKATNKFETGLEEM